MQRSLRSDVNYKRINKYCEGSSPTWKCQSLGVSVCRGTRNSGSFQSSHMKSLVQVSRGSLRTGPKIYTNCSSCTNRTKDSETETWYCDPNLAGSLGNPPSPWNTYSALGKKSPARCSSRWKSANPFHSYSLFIYNEKSFANIHFDLLVTPKLIISVQYKMALTFKFLQPC